MDALSVFMKQNPEKCFAKKKTYDMMKLIHNSCIMGKLFYLEKEEVMYKKWFILLAMVLACGMAFADGVSGKLSAEQKEASSEGSRITAYELFSSDEDYKNAITFMTEKLEAISDEIGKEAQRAVPCAVCNNGYLQSETHVVSGFEETGRVRKCTARPRGSDYEMDKRTMTSYSCTYCNYRKTIFGWAGQQYWDCRGYY